MGGGTVWGTKRRGAVRGVVEQSKLCHKIKDERRLGAVGMGVEAHLAVWVPRPSTTDRIITSGMTAHTHTLRDVLNLPLRKTVRKDERSV